jgi:type II secretory pathway component PulM
MTDAEKYAAMCKNLQHRIDTLRGQLAAAENKLNDISAAAARTTAGGSQAPSNATSSHAIAPRVHGIRTRG